MTKYIFPIITLSIIVVTLLLIIFALTGAFASANLMVGLVASSLFAINVFVMVKYHWKKVWLPLIQG